IPQAEVGRAELISDVYGVFAYTYKLDEALAKYLTTAKRHAKIFVYIGVKMDETNVKYKDGVRDRTIGIIDWIKTRVKGVRSELKELPGIANAQVLVLQRDGENISIPKLRLVRADRHNPPV